MPAYLSSGLIARRASAPGTPEIVVFVGDSETAGRAQNAWSLPESTSYGDGTAKTWDWITNTFITAADINSYQSLFGLVTPATRSMVKPTCWRRAQTIGATVYGMNFGWGGMVTQQWLTGDTSTNGQLGIPGVNLINTTITRVNQARAAHPEADLKFVIYMGANDAASAGYVGPGVAKANVLATIAALRAGITGATNAPVYVVCLPNLTVANPYAAHWSDIYSELLSIEDVPNGIYLVRAYRGWQWELYGVHPEALGYEDAGIRLANRMAGNADAFSTITAPNSGQITGLHDLLDPGAGRTMNGSDVSHWVDQQSAIDFLQTGTPAKQPAYEAVNATLNNRPAIRFVDDQLDAAAGTVATHIYLHSGPCTVFFVLDVDASNSDGYVFTTVSPGNATPGVVLRIAGTTTSWYNYRAANVLYGGTNLTDVSASGKRWGVIRMTAAGAIQVKINDQWNWTSPAYSGSPSTGNHNPPRLGQNNSNLKFVGAIGKFYAFNRDLTDYEIMRETEYLRAEFNLFAA